MEKLKFNTAKNFKKSSYILGRWRLKDFIVMILSLLMAIVYIISYASSQKGSSNLIYIVFILCIGILPLVLFMPIANYFNAYKFITTSIKYVVKKKRYHWKGVIYDEE